MGYANGNISNIKREISGNDNTLGKKESDINMIF